MIKPRSEAKRLNALPVHTCIYDECFTEGKSSHTLDVDSIINVNVDVDVDVTLWPRRKPKSKSQSQSDYKCNCKSKRQ